MFVHPCRLIESEGSHSIWRLLFPMKSAGFDFFILCLFYDCVYERIFGNSVVLCTAPYHSVAGRHRFLKQTNRFILQKIRLTRALIMLLYCLVNELISINGRFVFFAELFAGMSLRTIYLKQSTGFV